MSCLLSRLEAVRSLKAAADVVVRSFVLTFSAAAKQIEKTRGG